MGKWEEMDEKNEKRKEGKRRQGWEGEERGLVLWLE